MANETIPQDEQPHDETPDIVHMVKAQNNADLLSPEFIIALLLVIAFNVGLLVFKTEAMQGALILQFGTAVGYFLGETREKRRPK